jgi:arabinofuranan 3-O-arabinosyltransferase
MMRGVWRLRLAVTSAVLMAFAFLQRPGMITADTKLDLALDPEGFLGRALHLWDPSAAFGQVQNQSYGYLLPMGSFFIAGDLAGLPGWVVQRLWLGAVMVVAFLGVVRLSRLLGIGSPWVRLIAGLAYALSPRMMTTLGPISVEALPSALAPWCLVPLVSGSLGGSVRRAGARAGVAVGLVGGVNAAASAAVLPLGAVWLATRRRGERLGQLWLWWILAVALATLWWLVPLALLGRYSPPFLDFIENAKVTTVPTTLVDSLRGASHWVAYINPDWNAGGQMIQAGWIVLNTVVLAALGLAGIARRDNPHRLFLVAALLAGLLLVTFGHLGTVQGWFAPQQNELLDGVLAPLRNVHKFDPVIRLPLVLGMAHLLGLAARHVRSAEVSRRIVARTALGVACLLVAGVASPLWVARLTPPAAFPEVPGYWQQTADWLAAHDANGRALLVPASKFGDYLWGRPHDEPIQALAKTPWAVRDGIPLAPPGTIAMLDAVERRLSDGTGSPGLAPFLRMSGVDYLVVRNDLDLSWTGAADPALVHQALSASPGIRRLATFGPQVGGDALVSDTDTQRFMADSGLRARHPAVEIYAVDSPSLNPLPGAAAAGGDTRVDARSMSSIPVLEGGPEAVLAALDTGVVDGPVMLAADRPPDWPAARYVLTDARRRQQAAFGSVRDNRSATLALDDPLRGTPKVRDYTADDRHETVAVLEGARRISASASGSDPGGLTGADQSAQPFAAFDGDPGTAWRPPVDVDPAGQWVQIEFERPTDLTDVAISIPARPAGLDAWAQPTRLRLDTGTAQTTVDVAADATSVYASLPRPADRLRVTIEQVAHWGGRIEAPGIADIVVPGVQVSRPLLLPTTRTEPDTILLARSGGDRDGCVRISGTYRCDPRLVRSGEEGSRLDRIVALPRAATYDLRLLATPAAGSQLESWMWRTAPVKVTASSRSLPTPKTSPMTVLDNDMGTGWTAAVTDARPSLTVRLQHPVRADSISLRVADILAAARPGRVRISAGGQTRTVTLDAGGSARFAMLTGRVFTIELTAAAPGTTVSTRDGTSDQLPIGVSELRLSRGETVVTTTQRTSNQRLQAPCGSGPSVVVNGSVHQTAVDTSRRDVLAGGPVEMSPCDEGVELRRGRNRISLVPSATFRAATAVFAMPTNLANGGGADDAVATRVPKGGWGHDERRVQVGTRQSLSVLTLGENTNAGWRARAGGQTLQPVVLNGWQQGWVLPAGGGRNLALDYTPDPVYRGAIAAGALTFLLAIVLALFRRPDEPNDGPPLTAARPHPVLAVVAGPVVLGLLGGWIGLVAAIAVLLVLQVVRSDYAASLRMWLAAAPLCLAAVIYGVEAPDVLTSTVPQVLALVSVAAAATTTRRRWRGWRGRQPS